MLPDMCEYNLKNNLANSRPFLFCSFLPHMLKLTKLALQVEGNRER